MLDVGCAADFFLRVMRQQGHEDWTLEPSPAIARCAVESLGKEHIFIGTLEGIRRIGDILSGSLNLVTMWDVIEHVPDPQPCCDRYGLCCDRKGC